MKLGDLLKDQIAIVTGGSRGYEAGIAEALALAGATVYITGRDRETLEATAEKLAPLDIRPFRGDVSDPADWDALFDHIDPAHGRLDILVNNAGEGVKIGTLTEQSDDSISRSLSINLTGAILGCRRAAHLMVPRGSGLIINVGSVCAKHAWPGWSIYSAAKAGLLHFTRCLLTELRPSGVRVTSVLPSWGQTDFTPSAGLDQRPPEILEKCIAPSELGDLIVQIATAPAHLVTEEITLWPMVQPMQQL